MILSSVVVMASLLIVCRLLTYQRRGANYCFTKSLLAYVLIFSFGAQAIDIMFNLVPVTWAQAGMTMGMTWLVLRSKGNVATIFRKASKV